jgi:hypothetical protein
MRHRGDATGPPEPVQGCRLRRFAAYPPARPAQYSDDGVGAGMEHDRAASVRTGDGTSSHRPTGRKMACRCSSPIPLMDEAGKRPDSMYRAVTAQ